MRDEERHHTHDEVAEFYDRVYHRDVHAAGRPGRQLVDY